MLKVKPPLFNINETSYELTKLMITWGGCCGVIIMMLLRPQDLLGYLQMFYRITGQYCHDGASQLCSRRILQAPAALVPDGGGLASCSYILYSLCLILGEDGPAEQEDSLSVCQRPREKRSTMLRRVEGFK